MYKRILVPLDGSELAEQVLPYVQVLGKVSGVSIELLRVFEPTLEQLAHRLHTSYCDRALAYLNRIKASIEGVGTPVYCTVHEEDPASHIIIEAEKVPDTLIAMATHGRSGPTRWVLGSVTDKVVHATSRPLLIIRAVPQDSFSTDVKLKTVLVPVDGSPLAEQVLPHVMGLAKSLRLKVILVRITTSVGEHHRYLDRHPVNASATVYYGPYEEFFKETDARAMQYLLKVKEELRQMGVSSVEETLLHGDPGGAIVDLAREIPNSLVAMTTHGRSGLGRWLLGSVAAQAVRHSGVPVVVIRAVEPAATTYPTLRGRPA